MILVDSSIWVDHFRGGDPTLQSLLDADDVVCHPFVIGEILMGNVRNWSSLRKTMDRLPQAIVAKDAEVLDFVFRCKLYGLGIGYIDAHLLASIQLTDETKLWSRDRRMVEAARKLDLVSLNLPSLQ